MGWLLASAAFSKEGLKDTSQLTLEPHQNLQTTFSLFLKMNAYKDKHCIFRKTW